VIVVNEIFGLHAYILDVCRRFARLGYVAVAPGFFDRAGDPAPLTDMAAIRKIVMTATDAQVMGDVGVTLTWLSAQPFVAARRIAITGFCWGGHVVWDACETFPQLRAGVSWYGQMAPPSGAPADPSRIWPIDHVADLRCPVLGLYGGKDPLSQAVPAMRAALEGAGKTTSQIVVYDDAGHGFHADYRSSYNAADAADGWKRLLAFFAANGAPPVSRP
jgi:carboxymethylenebutenolidase